MAHWTRNRSAQKLEMWTPKVLYHNSSSLSTEGTSVIRGLSIIRAVLPPHTTSPTTLVVIDDHVSEMTKSVNQQIILYTAHFLDDKTVATMTQLFYENLKALRNTPKSSPSRQSFLLTNVFHKSIRGFLRYAEEQPSTGLRRISLQQPKCDATSFGDWNHFSDDRKIINHKLNFVFLNLILM